MASSPTLEEFLKTAEGRSVTPEELSFLRAYRASRGRPTTVTYLFLLLARRSEVLDELPSAPEPIATGGSGFRPAVAPGEAPEEFVDGLRERLRECRKHSGLTQEQVARRVGVTSITISRYERGNVRAPDVETLSKIAKLYGTTVDWLLRGDRKR